jgi:hypothetical protein
MPAGVPNAAVAEARDMPDEDLIRTEGMTVGAAVRWGGDPLAGGRPDEIALHVYKDRSAL